MFKKWKIVHVRRNSKTKFCQKNVPKNPLLLSKKDVLKIFKKSKCLKINKDLNIFLRRKVKKMEVKKLQKCQNVWKNQVHNFKKCRKNKFEEVSKNEKILRKKSPQKEMIMKNKSEEWKNCNKKNKQETWKINTQKINNKKKKHVEFFLYTKLKMKVKCAKKVQKHANLYTCEEIRKHCFEKKKKKMFPLTKNPILLSFLNCKKYNKRPFQKKSSKRLKMNKVWQQFQIYRSEKVMANTEVKNVKEAK